MKFLTLILACLLTACAGNIAGITPPQRDALYTTAATLSGHAEYIALIYGTRRLVTSAKQPRTITP